MHRILCERFDEGELRTLCFYLQIDYDNLPGVGKENKARELVVYLDRRERLSELVEAGQKQRPDIPWRKNDIGGEGRSIPRKVTAHAVIVDEDASFTRLVAEALAKLGLTVAEAYSPESALKLVKRYQPDTVLMGWTGREGAGTWAKECRGLCPNVKIIGFAASSWPDDKDVLDAFDYVLLKPCTIEEIAAVLGLE